MNFSSLNLLRAYLDPGLAENGWDEEGLRFKYLCPYMVEECTVWSWSSNVLPSCLFVCVCLLIGSWTKQKETSVLVFILVFKLIPLIWPFTTKCTSWMIITYYTDKQWNHTSLIHIYVHAIFITLNSGIFQLSCLCLTSLYKNNDFLVAKKWLVPGKVTPHR